VRRFPWLLRAPPHPRPKHWPILLTAQISLGFSRFTAPLPDQDEFELGPFICGRGTEYDQPIRSVQANGTGTIHVRCVARFHSVRRGGLVARHGQTDPVCWSDSSLARWTSLRHFDISNNMLTGSIATELFPAWSGSLTGLAANDNELGGTLPAQIGLLSKLEVLLMVNNDFFGPLPTAIGSLTSLKLLELAGNRLSGTIPVAVLNLTNAVYVSLERNNFTGVAPYCAAAADDIIVPINVLEDCQAVVCPCRKRCSD
jgi:hypothetical protein